MIAVFIDGCYWHGCPEHYQPSKTNVSYWGPKIEANRERDRGTDSMLRSEGWTVLRFWEHEPAESVAARIEREVRSAGAE